MITGLEIREMNLGQCPRRPTQSGTVPLFVEQFYKSGTVPQFMEQCPKTVEQLPKIGTCAEIGSLLHELWNNSTTCGTVPAKSGAGTMNSRT